jgi:hypothetical protein
VIAFRVRDLEPSVLSCASAGTIGSGLPSLLPALLAGETHPTPESENGARPSAQVLRGGVQTPQGESPVPQHSKRLIVR